MPFSKGSVSDKLKGKGIPQSHVDQWVEVFNSVLDKTGDEGKAYRQANIVMNNALHKDGFRKGRDGKWHKESDEVEESIAFIPPPSRLVIVEEEGDTLETHRENGMRIRGVALVDEAVSQLGSGLERYYSKEFNDRCLEHTENFMGRGYPVTVYNTHGSALGGFLAAPNKSPIGKVEKLYREADKIMYEMFISPTQEGRDVIQLVHDNVMSPTSVRIYDFKARYETLKSEGEDGDESIMVLEDGYIGGIDFCDVPGIPEAGATEIMEKLEFGQQREETMDWKEVTLDEIKENRLDLLQSYVGEAVQGLLAERDALKQQVSELENKAADTSKIVSLVAEIAAKDAEIQVWESAATPVVKEVARKLKEIAPEERQSKAEEIRAEAFAAILAEVTPAKGEVQETVGDIGDVVEEKDVPEEIEEMFGTQLRTMNRMLR